MTRPESVNILGKQYSITYVDNPVEVDRNRRNALWGQVDYWTRTIRVYSNETLIEDIWQTILHETIHAIAEELHMRGIQGAANEETVALLALALTDVLIRNDWLKQ